MAKFSMTQMTGVIPAMITLFDEHENVDVKRTREMTEFLIARGADGLYLTGSTGEGFLMDHEERKLVVETVVDQVAGRIPVIVHIGDIGTRKSIELAKHAEAAGADAVSSVPPFYWKFSNDDIFNYYKDISEATSLPMVIYSVPLAGSMGMDLIKRIAQLPNVKGLKFTGREHDQMACLKQDLGEDFIIYSGCDEMAMSGLAVGADGIIGSFYNVMPELFKKIFAAVKGNDIKAARRLQQIGTAIILECVKYDYLALMRNMIGWQGVDAGYSRRPFRNYDDSELDALKAYLLSVRDKYNVTDEEVRFFAGLR